MKNREMAQLTAQLKTVLTKYQQGQTLLQREREKVREALLDSGKAHSLTIGRSAEHGDKLQSVLQDLGICQLLQLQRIRVIAQEIVDKIKSYEPGE